MKAIVWQQPLWAWAAAAGWLLGMAWLWASWRQQNGFRQRLQMAPVSARARWRSLALLTALFFAGLGLAQPALNQSSEGPSGEAVDLVVALDLSRSMLSEDVAPSRLGRAKELLYELVANPPKQLRLGLIVFAGQAFVQMPLSPDMVTAQMQIQAAQPSNLPLQGTAIAAALQRGAVMLDNKEIRQKNLWLMTDGENHEPGMDEALAALKRLGTTVTSIGFGTEQGAIIRNPFTGSPQTDAEGNAIITKPNVALLRDIAAASNGRYVDGNDLSEAGTQLRQLLAATQGRQAKAAITAQTSVAIFPLGIALALFIFWLLFADVRARKLAGLAALICLPFFSIAQQKNITYKEAYKALQQGHTAFSKGDFGEADLHYQQAEKHPHLSTVVRYNRALIAYQQKQFAPSAEGFAGLATHRQLLVANRAANNQGLALARQQQWKPAVEAFKQALRNDPADKQARENLQLALHKLKEQSPPPPDQKQQQQKNKQPPPQQMNQQKAEDLLNQLRQKESQLRKQLQRKPQGEGGQGKDW